MGGCGELGGSYEGSKQPPSGDGVRGQLLPLATDLAGPIPEPEPPERQHLGSEWGAHCHANEPSGSPSWGNKAPKSQTPPQPPPPRLEVWESFEASPLLVQASVLYSQCCQVSLSSSTRGMGVKLGAPPMPSVLDALTGAGEAPWKGLN